MNARKSTLPILVLLLAAAGCATRTPTQAEQDQKLKDQAATATVKARKEAEVAGAQARVAAADAERKLNDIASGVKQGWKDSKPVPTIVNLNHASRTDLVRLPGISVRKADRIIAARPYRSSQQLVAKGILTQQQYDRISDRLTAH